MQADKPGLGLKEPRGSRFNHATKSGKPQLGLKEPPE
jgi:hypothetical protein